jgi:hypothetical protein
MRIHLPAAARRSLRPDDSRISIAAAVAAADRRRWRPLAAILFGYAPPDRRPLGDALGTIVFLLRRIGPWAAVAVIVLSFSLGEQLGSRTSTPRPGVLPARSDFSIERSRSHGQSTVIVSHRRRCAFWLAGGFPALSPASPSSRPLGSVVVGSGGVDTRQYLGTLELSGRPAGASRASSATWRRVFLRGRCARLFALATRGKHRASFVGGRDIGPRLRRSTSGAVGLLGALAPWAFAAGVADAATVPTAAASLRSLSTAEDRPA